MEFLVREIIERAEYIMFRYVKAADERYVNNQKIRTAVRKMRELLGILDGMNEATFAVFDNACISDVYTTISDNLMPLSNRFLDE